VHRQAERTGIPLIASTLRHGNVPERSALVGYQGLGSGFSFIETASDDIPRTVLKVNEELGGIPEVQVIAATRAETSSMNRMLQRARLGREPVARFEPGQLMDEEKTTLLNGSTERSADLDKWEAELIEAMEAMEDLLLRTLSNKIFSKTRVRFRRAAAAFKVHHARRGGLLDTPLPWCAWRRRWADVFRTPTSIYSSSESYSTTWVRFLRVTSKTDLPRKRR
jgi:hypothetical protein